MPLLIARQDITKMKTDAIVNAANTGLQMGGGVCGAIFYAAGPSRMQQACDALAPIETGQAVITPGFNLPCRFVIHTAGPVYDRQNAEQCRRQLASCYRSSLQLASGNHCQSLSFPLISSGIYGYPKEEALQVAVDTISQYLKEHELTVYITIFDTIDVNKNLSSLVEQYIDDNFIDTASFGSVLMTTVPPQKKMSAAAERKKIVNFYQNFGEVTSSLETDNIDEAVDHLDVSFSAALLAIIDQKGMTDVEVYKRANIDRKLFSKIRSQKGYMPSKRTAIALAIATELSLNETNSLLAKAGYTLSHSQKFDVIIEYFIVNRRYDIFEINEVLFSYDQPLLGA